jgi:hypothetical protein
MTLIELLQLLNNMKKSHINGLQLGFKRYQYRVSIDTLGTEHHMILWYHCVILWTRPATYQAGSQITFCATTGTSHGSHCAIKSLVKLCTHSKPGCHSAVYIQMVSVTSAVSLQASSWSKCAFWWHHLSMSIVSVAVMVTSLYLQLPSCSVVCWPSCT